MIYVDKGMFWTNLGIVPKNSFPLLKFINKKINLFTQKICLKFFFFIENCFKYFQVYLTMIVGSISNICNT